MRKPLIIDAFVFADELDVLEIRLAELYNVVDYFILVEASKTQTRLDKPYYYLDNMSRFSSWNDKIISIQLSDYMQGGAGDWSMENWQRNQIFQGIQKLYSTKCPDLQPYDYLLVSDLDEIPASASILEILKYPDLVVSFNFRFISYFANFHCPSRGWYGTVACPLKFLSPKLTPQTLRNIKDVVVHIGDWNTVFHGWHLSAMGGFDTVWKKAINNIEPHDKTILHGRKEELRQLFNQHVIQDKYFLFLDNPQNKSLKLDILDDSYLPKYLIENKIKFQHFFFPNS